jgi:hypothetical protein
MRVEFRQRRDVRALDQLLSARTGGRDRRDEHRGTDVGSPGQREPRVSDIKIARVGDHAVSAVAAAVSGEHSQTESSAAPDRPGKFLGTVHKLLRPVLATRGGYPPSAR